MAKKLPVFGISVGAVSAIVVSILAVNIVSSIIEIDNTNKLIEANSQTPIEYIDESELEEGLTTYRYEAERAEFSGFSSNGAENYDHACAGASFKFGEEYSGGIALRNIFSSPSLDTPNQFVFNINSDKNVKVKALMKCSGSTVNYSSSFAVGDLFSLKVNNKNVRLTGKLAMTYDDGLVDVHFVLPLVEGENEIKVITKPYTSVSSGYYDYLELYTTASLTDFEEKAWDMSGFNITMPPMLHRYGSAEYVCESTNETYYIDTIPSIEVGLNEGMYDLEEKEENGEKITEYYFANTDKLVSSDPLPKTVQHKLKIQSKYVTFKDGSQEQDVWEFYEFPEFVNTLEGYNVIGWYQLDDRSNVFETKQFFMPKNDLTVVPILDTVNYKNVFEREEHAKFNEGKPEEEWVNSNLYGSFNGKIELNDKFEDDQSVTYKPIHTNSSATTGFDIETLRNNVKDDYLEDDNFAEKATMYSYDKVKTGWTMLTCASCKLSYTYPKTIKVKMENKGSSTLNFDFWFSTSSGNPTGSNKNPHVSGISLKPNDTKMFELDVKFSNTNIMSYIVFNSDSSELKLVMTQYVENVSQAAEHNVSINNIPNTNYTVTFGGNNNAKVKEGKTLPDLTINAPENYVLDGFVVDNDMSVFISPGDFIMGNKDVTLTPVFRYQHGNVVDITKTDADNGAVNYIHSRGLSGFDSSILKSKMRNEVVLKGQGNNTYYELSTVFEYEGGLKDTSTTYSFMYMAGCDARGTFNITYVLTNQGTETLSFKIGQPNTSGEYNSSSTIRTDLIELKSGETRIVTLTANLNNNNVLGYFEFNCHTTTDMHLSVSQYAQKV